MLLVFFCFFLIVLILFTAKVKINLLIKDNKKKCYFYIIILNKIIIYKYEIFGKKNKNDKRKKKRKKSIRTIIRNYNNLVTRLNINLEILKLNLKISANDPIITSYSVFLFSNLITFLLKKYNLKINYERCNYKVIPVYENKKIFNYYMHIVLSCNAIRLLFEIYRQKINKMY